MIDVRLIEGDCIEQMGMLAAEGVLVDSIVTDPPYHLTNHSNKFAGRCADLVNGVGDWNQGAMGRLARGFMGQRWDGGAARRPV
jgi:DNA modification methylase